MKATELKRIRVLVNRRSGLKWSFDAVQQAFDAAWERPGRDIVYQFLHGVEDGVEKARRAVEDGVDLVLVVGGDGTFSSIGRVLAGTDVCLGTIPTGSGNGWARHFNVPLDPAAAAASLARGVVRRVDVGRVNDRPFFITCSMAWDAALVKSFDRMPMRGILPYVFAGVYELFDYKPQPMTICLDGDETMTIEDALVFTVANLSQYGGGAVITPHAEPDDGLLELVIARRQDMPILIANIGKFLAGAVTDIPTVLSRRFRDMTVTRPKAAPIQVDGELLDSPGDVHFTVSPRAIRALVPA